jgi:predicted RNase H-like nuclease
MSDRERRGQADRRAISAEAVETLLWLLERGGLDRRRYQVVNRLRSVRDSDQFATLPEDLRERVREIVAENEG